MVQVCGRVSVADDRQFCVLRWFPPLQGALETFLRAPEGYLGQALPKPLPTRGVPRDPASLGAEQYVEETLAALVNGSMLALSQRRTTLQHPELGARKAALRFIAHYLKSHNPRNSAQIAAHERARLDEFVASATLAVREGLEDAWLEEARAGGARGSGARAVKRLHAESVAAIKAKHPPPPAPDAVVAALRKTLDWPVDEEKTKKESKGGAPTENDMTPR